MKKVIFAIIFCIILSISAFASQPSVVDALHYVKDVITVDYALDMGIEQGAFGKHSIVIPKINIDTPAVQKINQEMYEFGSGAYELLLKNQEDNMIYNYGYFYKEECGVIGIILTKIGGIQCGGGNSDYKAFYYDIRTDKQLSFKEYLSALGVNINDLKNNPAVKKAYKNAGQEGSIVVLDAILDSKSSAVYVKTPMSMNASMIIKSDTPLVNIEIKDPFALYTGKANEIVMTLGSKTAYVSGNEVGIDAEPIISNGRTMLPARFVAEKLGATVDWDALSRKVIIKKDALKIELIVNSSVAYVNGREVALDSPVFIQNGRTYTPVRFVAEKLGAVVEWMSTTKQVVISYHSLKVGYAVYIEKDRETDDERYKTNYVIIPEIKSNSKTARLINAKMRDYFKIFENDIDNSSEVYDIIKCKFYVREVDGVIGIIVTKDYSYKDKFHVFSECKAFYYDMNNDVELSYKEYLDTIGISKKDLLATVKASMDPNNFDISQEYFQIFDAIVDNESSVIIDNNSVLHDKHFKEMSIGVQDVID